MSQLQSGWGGDVLQVSEIKSLKLWGLRQCKLLLKKLPEESRSVPLSVALLWLSLNTHSECSLFKEDWNLIFPTRKICFGIFSSWCICWIICKSFASGTAMHFHLWTSSLLIKQCITSHKNFICFLKQIGCWWRNSFNTNTPSHMPVLPEPSSQLCSTGYWLPEDDDLRAGQDGSFLSKKEEESCLEFQP